MQHRIVRLQAENVKGIRAVDITPPPGLVQITGRNGQGKSSVLDAIIMAIRGTKYAPEEPIRHGAEQAQIIVDCDEFVVKRVFSAPDKMKLKISSKDGHLGKTPQEFLNGFLGKLGFDPLEFARMNPKDQVNVLSELIDVPINLQEWEKKRQKIYDDRTETNRRLRDLEGQLKALTPPQPGLPAEEVNLSDLMLELQKRSDQLTENNRKRMELESLRAKQAELQHEIKEKLLELERLQCSLEDLNERVEVRQKEIDGLQDPDIPEIQNWIKSIEDTNRCIREAGNYQQLQKSIDFHKAQSADLTDALKNHEEKKRKSLQQARYPIHGLEIGDEYVIYNGIPFSQLSDSEALRVSLAVAMAMNPDLRVILIKNGSLLDSDSLTIIQNMAKEKDYQVWIECVDESGDVGIVIEDGEVMINNYKSTEES